MSGIDPRRIRLYSCFSVVLIALLGLIGTPNSLLAQQATIHGTVESDVGEPIAGAAIQVANTQLGVLSDSRGEFVVGPLAPGSYTLEVSALGFGDASRQVQVGVGSNSTPAFRLTAEALALPGIQVSVLRPDMRPEGNLEGEQVRQANPRDVGEALRVLPGVDAVRRGPLGLDPVVRGLRETEVGVYLNGTRQFPAGPARMDSPLTHLDPSALESVEVVKGPYALTWGAGNMSAIRVETQPVPPNVMGPLHGSVLAGYDANLGAVETAASLSGERDRVAYWLHGAWRQGDDYDAGDDTLIPGDFLSRELRGKVGFRVTPGSWLSISGGYQKQDDLDYPGRLLNAEYFRASNISAEWEWKSPGGVLRSVDAQVYANDVDHGMTNDGKPTAEPMAGRMPPFALDVTVDSEVKVQGGRVDLLFQPTAALELELGSDVYRANRDALRTIARRDNGMVMFEDLMWPDATITDAGAFARAARDFAGGFNLSGTLRVDQVQARADTASAFFLDNVSRSLDMDETNVSAAIVASAQPLDNWTASVGLGTVVRTADATERYSDRIPASKAQTSAEFVGTPGLEPERSTQADVWLEATYPRLTLSLNAFARRIADYITLAPTSLPRRLPLSPTTVFEYVNGEAEFYGGEATLAYALTDPLSVALTANYLHGEDTSIDEPALGVSPSHGSARLRWDPPSSSYYLQTTVQTVGDQDRVATTRGEIATDGYTTVDAEGGFQLTDSALLRVGVRNLFDEDYVNHLNAKNPYTGLQIPEPGRVLFTRISYAF